MPIVTPNIEAAVTMDRMTTTPTIVVRTRTPSRRPQTPRVGCSTRAAASAFGAAGEQQSEIGLLQDGLAVEVVPALEAGADPLDAVSGRRRPGRRRRSRRSGRGMAGSSPFTRKSPVGGPGLDHAVPQRHREKTGDRSRRHHHDEAPVIESKRTISHQSGPSPRIAWISTYVVPPRAMKSQAAAQSGPDRWGAQATTITPPDRGEHDEKADWTAGPGMSSSIWVQEDDEGPADEGDRPEDREDDDESEDAEWDVESLAKAPVESSSHADAEAAGGTAPDRFVDARQASNPVAAEIGPASGAGHRGPRSRTVVLRWSRWRSVWRHAGSIPDSTGLSGAVAANRLRTA